MEEGLPQGSVLSCILFLVFINGISKALDRLGDPCIQKSLYVDDLVFWANGIDEDKIRGSLQKGVKGIGRYCLSMVVSFTEWSCVMSSIQGSQG